jgi:hypothetical protein
VEKQQTCGQGLAENSVLPALLAELIASLADNSALHMQALDLTDLNAKREYDAYHQLADDYRSIATHMQSTAHKMAGYRDLPMGRHDQNKMSRPEVFKAFEHFVMLEHELGRLLQHKLEQEQKMLGQMGGAAGS